MIGAIADDFTGATDAAAAFRRSGLATAVVFETFDDDSRLSTMDAVVLALKTRTIDPADAVAQSLAGVRWLRSLGADQFFFKYCSTFDSRPEGNIGPVADALVDELGAGTIVIAPSSPEHGRTQYLGHLFVGSSLLSDSPMRHHPLTPMTDSRIPELLRPQTVHPVALATLDTVRSGAAAVRAFLDALAPSSYAVMDANGHADLAIIGDAVKHDVLVTGAAGMAAGLGAAVARRDAGSSVADRQGAPDLSHSAVLAGSCSARTLEQLDDALGAHPALRLDVLSTPDARALADAALGWFDALPAAPAPIIYSSMPPAELRVVQAALGAETASELLETAMGRIATGLIDRGVTTLIVAGGETSGAVVSSLGVRGGVLGREVAPGVPWIHSLSREPISLLLKSGNFGGVRFFRDALQDDERKSAA